MKINDPKTKDTHIVPDLKTNIREPLLIFKKDGSLVVKTPGKCRLNVRASPDSTSVVMTTVPYGERVDIQWIEEKEWVRVKTGNNIIGYCLLTFLDVS